jgi:ribose-phosphate pyrophosphokinase
VLSGAAIDNISASALDELVVTDTIPLADAAQKCAVIRQLTVAELIGESINRMNRGQSLSSMFVD